MNPLTQTVLSLSIGGTMMALMLYGMRLVFKNRLPSTFYYYAWLLVLLRFVLPLPGLLPLPDGSGARTAEGTELTERTADMLREAGGTQGEINGEINALREPRLPLEAGFAPALAPKVRTEAGNSAGNVNAAVGAELPEELLLRLRQGVKPETLLALLWAAGAALCFTRYLISYTRFARALHRTLRPARESDLALLAALGGGRRPELKRSAAAATPMLVGVLRPKIILPDRDYDDKTLENILRHELTHYRRRDLVCKWFAVGIYALHWFNPVTRLMRRELDRDCELSCDERLLRHMDRLDKQSYGETLIDLAAEKALPRRVVATTFATEKRNLKERLVQIMTYKNKGRATLALVLVMLMLLCGCGAAAGPAASRGEETPAEVQAPVPTPDGTPAPIRNLYVDKDKPVDAKTEPVTYTNNVTVKTVDELLAAIAPDTCITMEMGVYNLSTAENYGVSGGTYYYWEDVSEGYELVITGVDKLCIRGTDADEVILSAKPRVADVLSFRKCANIAVGDLTAGHTEEPGVCIGGVLEFLTTDGIVVDDCALYGCGIVGVTARDCINIRVEDTDIYDCSMGAARLESCYNALFDDCEVYDCEGGELFGIYASNEVAIINSDIHDNSVGYALISSRYSQGVYLGGVEAKNQRYRNEESGVIYAVGSPITVDGCELGGESVAKWFATWDKVDVYGGAANVGAVSPDGTRLTGDDLAKMKCRDDVVWWSKELQDLSAEALNLKTDEDGMIHVSTVDELLAAIAPNTTIYLEPGEYDLGTATGYGSFGGKYHSWLMEFDGPQLNIANVKNLTIRAESADKASIVTAPRYADVLHFTNCDGLTLENFTAGHTEEPSQCMGDVLGIEDCDEVKVEGCSLYGCGVIGISAYDCEEMKITGTEIYGCSYGAVQFRSCENISMETCDVHSNGESTYSVYDSENVTLDGKPLREGITI